MQRASIHQIERLAKANGMQDHAHHGRTHCASPQVGGR
ncbi:Uncharacterised protein [Vibrio cholerae]|nr:Uncharacterised protein [Vibrio cholerae]